MNNFYSREFIAIDNFELHREQDLWDRTPADVFGPGTHRDAYETRFATFLVDGTVRVLQGQSAECLEGLPDRSLDVVYIDADHRYDYVRQDLAAAALKVKDDGWIIVNDYIMVPTLRAEISYGVVNATHEFMLAYNWGMQYLALHTRVLCDVALRPADLLDDGASAFRDEIAALRGSTSWRLTAPLRMASKSLGRWTAGRARRS